MTQKTINGVPVTGTCSFCKKQTTGILVSAGFNATICQSCCDAATAQLAIDDGSGPFTLIDGGLDLE